MSVTVDLLAVEPLSDVELWLRSDALEIVFLVSGAVLLARGVAWACARISTGIARGAHARDALVRSEAAKHQQAVTQVLSWVGIVLVYAVAVMLVVDRLGVPVSGLVAPATVLGVALGFGAQRIVQDVLAGFFLVAERHYGLGDLVRLQVTGVMAPVVGTVEDVTLRATRLRTPDGEVVTAGNGQVTQVTNLSRDWARAVVDVPLPLGVDLAAVTASLQRIGSQAYADPALRPFLLDEPTVIGVETLAADQLELRLVARTLPGQQFEVGRTLRSRVLPALREHGVDGGDVKVPDTTGGAAGGERP